MSFTSIKAKGIYSPHSCLGGFAFMVQSGQEQIADNGPVDTASGSTEADAIAIWKALEAARGRELLDAGARTRISTDSRELVAILLLLIPSSRNIGPEVRQAQKVGSRIRECQAVRRIIEIARERQLAIEFEPELMRPQLLLEGAREGFAYARRNA